MASSFSVNNFRSQLTGDGARPSLFRVKVYAPSWVGLDSEKFSFLANGASLPSAPLGDRTIPYMGQDVKFAGDRTYPDYDIQVINDENFELRNAFERWNNAISQYSREDSVRLDGASSDPNSYTGTVIVEQLGKENVVLKTYELVNAWPALISQVALSWYSKDDIEEFFVSFRYDYFESKGSTT